MGGKWGTKIPYITFNQWNEDRNMISAHEVYEYKETCINSLEQCHVYPQKKQPALLCCCRSPIPTKLTPAFCQNVISPIMILRSSFSTFKISDVQQTALSQMAVVMKLAIKSNYVMLREFTQNLWLSVVHFSVKMLLRVDVFFPNR